MGDESQLIKKLEEINALVIGDAILDRYIYGHVERISREAPIPVFEIQKTEERPGGACNTAVNVAQFANTSVLGIVGNDSFGGRLIELLNSNRVNTTYLFRDESVQTTVKDRYIAKGQQMFRADIEHRKMLPERLVSQIVDVLKSKGSEFDCIIASDHQISFFSESIFNAVLCLTTGPKHPKDSDPKFLVSSVRSDVQHKDFATINEDLTRKTPVYLDARPQSYRYFKGATLFKVNHADASKIFGAPLETLGDLKKFGEKVLNEKLVEIVVVTLGDKGCYVHSDQYSEHFDVQKVEVSDVSGAGDTFLAIFSLIHFATQDIKLAARLANRASSRVVQRFGTSSVTKSELVEDMSSLIF